MPNTENQYMETDLGNVSPNPRGEYSASEKYEYLDTVSYEGGSYLCRAELGTTVSGKAPVAGENTDTWQMLTLPGGLTSEYVAMHDNVASKAIQVESSRAVVELAQQEVEAAQADVQQLHSDTVAASQAAEESRDSAAGYAQAAEASRTAAQEAESNVNAQVNGFDEHVTQQITKAEEDITKARQQAVSTVESQQATSIQYVQDQTAAYTEAKKKEISDTTEAVKKTVEEAGANQIKAIADSLDKNLDTAGKAADAGATGKAIGEVKDGLENANKDIKELADKKITKFYASNQGETYLADSDNGNIQDMMLYGRSEQKQYNGYQLIPLRLKDTNGTILNLPYTRSGITVDVVENGRGVSVKGTNAASDYIDFYITLPNEFSLEAGIYTRSGKGFTKDVQMISGGGNSAGGCLIYRNDTSDFTQTETVEAGLSGNHIIRVTQNATINTTVYYQLEKGSVAHDFEPYTGGIPSPNPDYPQEIKSVVNPVVKACGKNLWKPYENGYISNTDGSITSSSASEIAATNFIKINGKDITIIASSFETSVKDSYAFRIGFYDADKRWIKNIVLNDNKEHHISDYEIAAAFIRVSAPLAIYDTLQIEYGVASTLYETYKEQLITLPYTLNAIPVESGGNVTINGQRYIADYVDVEHGKLVKMVGVTSTATYTTDGGLSSDSETFLARIDVSKINGKTAGMTFGDFLTPVKVNGLWLFDNECYSEKITIDSLIDFRLKRDRCEKSATKVNEYLKTNNFHIFYELATPEETDLTVEEIQKFKELATYYPATNISVTSNQLDGYIVFNYPVSLENGWNYVKQQLGDTRDYIYDMDARTKDIDTQSAEAYVNSEYAVALTELEVM